MSNYQAIIAKIDKVITIPNANTIQEGKVLGESVIISNELQEGFVGVYFCAGTQLQSEYCIQNNLYRDSEKNSDKTKTGFFDDNRRVRAQPFMKVKSEGYFAPLESLSNIGIDISKLRVGDSFEEIQGISVCKKYINPKARKENTNKKLKKKRDVPNFTEHVDTSQYKYKKQNIEEGDLISIQSKIHGCFPSYQKLLMWDGSKKKIKNIKKGDEVVGYKNGEAIRSKVLELFNNGRETCWVDLEFDRSGFLGNNTGKIRCTPNHRILCGDGEYYEASMLNKDSKVVFNHKTRKPSKSQIGAYLGMLLGDGYLSKSGNLQFCHKMNHEDYLNFKLDNFKCLGERINKNTKKRSGYGSVTIFNMLPKNCFLTEYFMKYQVKGVGKVLQEDIVKYATRETLAFLYMDDGSLTHNSLQKDRAMIAICGIMDKDIEIIVQIFNKFNIYPIYFKDINGYNRLRFNTNEAYKLFNTIKDLVPNCMKYKLPEEFRQNNKLKYCEKSKDAVYTCIRKLTKKPVISTDPKRKGCKYDIQTETSNYVAGEITVHNSSARYGYHLVNIDLPKWKQLINKVLPLFPEKEWEYVVGTRRVILDDPEKEGFHGNEGYRFEIMEKLKPYLSKGMTVYGEIAGFANDKPIMSVHETSVLRDKKMTKKYGDNMIYKYNCPDGELRFHIYRITVNTECGQSFDLTQEQIVKWCSDRSLLAAHDVIKPFIFDGDFDKLDNLVEELTERPDLLTEDYHDPSHINEGVIVRVDNGEPTPLFLKNKSYAFKMLEGIASEKVVEIEDLS